MAKGKEKVFTDLLDSVAGRRVRLVQEREEVARSQQRLIEIDEEIAELDLAKAELEKYLPKPDKPENGNAESAGANRVKAN